MLLAAGLGTVEKCMTSRSHLNSDSKADLSFVAMKKWKRGGNAIIAPAGVNSIPRRDRVQSVQEWPMNSSRKRPWRYDSPAEKDADLILECYRDKVQMMTLSRPRPTDEGCATDDGDANLSVKCRSHWRRSRIQQKVKSIKRLLEMRTIQQQ